jgi:hypothetical protein
MSCTCGTFTKEQYDDMINNPKKWGLENIHVNELKKTYKHTKARHLYVYPETYKALKAAYETNLKNKQKNDVQTPPVGWWRIFQYFSPSGELQKGPDDPKSYLNDQQWLCTEERCHDVRCTCGFREDGNYPTNTQFDMSNWMYRDELLAKEIKTTKLAFWQSINMGKKVNPSFNKPSVLSKGDVTDMAYMASFVNCVSDINVVTYVDSGPGSVSTYFDINRLDQPVDLVICKTSISAGIDGVKVWLNGKTMSRETN